MVAQKLASLYKEEGPATELVPSNTAKSFASRGVASKLVVSLFESVEGRSHKNGRATKTVVTATIMPSMQVTRSNFGSLTKGS